MTSSTVEHEAEHCGATRAQAERLQFAAESSSCHSSCADGSQFAEAWPQQPWRFGMCLSVAVLHSWREVVACLHDSLVEVGGPWRPQILVGCWRRAQNEHQRVARRAGVRILVDVIRATSRTRGQRSRGRDATTARDRIGGSGQQSAAEARAECGQAVSKLQGREECISLLLRVHSVCSNCCMTTLLLPCSVRLYSSMICCTRFGSVAV